MFIAKPLTMPFGSSRSWVSPAETPLNQTQLLPELKDINKPSYYKHVAPPEPFFIHPLRKLIINKLTCFIRRSKEAVIGSVGASCL